MAREPVFYSFHYDNDVFRVQQIRNMGVIDGDEPVSTNDWEQLKRKGDDAVERWIEENMGYKRCVIVLIGAETASRRWVKHEIKRAWERGKGLIGVHIHNLKCPRNGIGARGVNPFEQFTVGERDGQKRRLSELVTVHNPSALYAYSEIQANLSSWVTAAIEEAKRR
jgi:hypothetical protein